MAKENPLIKLRNDLKENNFEKLYVFSGDEMYLKDMYLKKILSTIPDDGFEEFNKIIIDAKESSLDDVADALESFPMMSDKKIVVVENSGIFKNAKAEEKDFYQKAFSELSDDTILIFSETEIDKRSALYKSASKAGAVIEFETPSETDLVAFVQREVMNAGGKIQKDVAEYLVNVCDSGLSNLKNEILKLCANCSEEIGKTDVDRLASRSLQTKVFDLCDLMMAKNTDGVLSMLADLRITEKSSFNLLYLLFSTFDKMLKVKFMEQEGMVYSEIVSDLGVAPFIAKKYINGAKAFSMDELVLMVSQVAETDLSIKQGRVDEWTAFESYINRFLTYKR